MPSLLVPARRRQLSAFLLILFSLAASHFGAAQTDLEISQIYGGGGNSGSTYTNDFIELFNPTAASITLSGASIQYASAGATGTTYTEYDLPASFTLAPGQFYLIQAAPGAAGTTPLPAPDAIIALPISATAGKVALVRSHTALSGVAGCPTSDPSLVDYVGFGGSSVTCSQVSPAPAATNTTAVVRALPCSPTRNNGADFVARAPVPHNSASTPVVCAASSVGTPIVAGGLPATGFQGAPVLLQVKVTPATLPASSGLSVSADLSSVGGSSSQLLVDDGSNGDLTANDGIYSAQITIANATAAGSVTLPVSVRDTQMRSATTSIALTVVAEPATVSIRQIQSAKPSPFAGQSITTSGIVTSIKTNGFYLEAADADTTPVTPEGVLVYTGSTPPASIVIGQLLQLSGKVSTYPTTSKTPGTEVDSPTNYTILQNSVALPAAIVLTTASDSPSGGITQFAKYEGMRVTIASFTTTSGTDASLTEATETNVSNGQFFGVVTGVPRPFREPGISVTEPALPAGAILCPLGAPAVTCIPQWDANPELLQVDSRSTGGAPIDLTTGTVLTNVIGVLDFSTGAPEVILDRTSRPTVAGGLTVPSLPVQASTEFTIASFNLERFYNDVVDGDNPGSSVVKVTTEAYQRRLAKASLAIRNVLNAPDVLGVQEVENLAVLTDLATRISSDAKAANQIDPLYQPYLYLATDGTGINTGMLVRSTRVDTVKAEQFGLTTTFTNASGNQAVLNDRTPLVVHVGFKRAGLPDYPVTVISVHQRSLINVDDTTSTGATVRLKREAQAEFLARLIQGYQAAGEHVVTVGDYNSFEFSDGFVDTLGVTLGTPVPATEVVTAPTAGLASPALVDLVTLLPAAQRQSYVEDGSAQVLDHIIATRDLASLNTRMFYAHIDSDFPLVDQNDATTPLRVSDHDPAVAYFTLPAPVLTLSATSLSFGTQLLTLSGTKTLTIANTGNDTLPLVTISITGAGFAQTNTCTTALAPGSTCVITVSFAPTVVGSATGSLTVQGSTAAVVNLTGVGGDFSLAATTPTATVTNGQTATLFFNLSSLGTYAGTVTFGCSGLTAGESCTITPVSSTLTSGSTALIAVAVATTAQQLPAIRRTLAADRSPLAPFGSHSNTALGGVGLAAMLACIGGRRSRALIGKLRLLSLLSLCLAAISVVTLSGCSGQSLKPNAAGTPSGTQNVTLTATSNGVSHTAIVALTVK